MKPPTRIAIRTLPRLLNGPSSPAVTVAGPVSHRAAAAAIHTSHAATAKVVPIYGTGPPPEPPAPSEDYPEARIARRKKQAELLRQAQSLRSGKGAAAAAKAGKSSPLKKRFWKDVHVKEVDGAYEVHLDARPLRHPTTKAIVRVPLSKPHLAHALALEWDLLTSSQQATRHHLVPLTSLVCRAIDIAEDDAAHASKTRRGDNSPFAPIRTSIATMLLRYLDTDSLLCWAPPSDSLSFHTDPETGDSLRARQERAAGEIVRFLTSEVWPGVEIEPVLDGTSIVPRGQKPGVREVVQGWVMGLEPWDLAGLERAALAGKGLLGAVRLVVEWSEGSAGRVLGANRDGDVADGGEAKRFGVEEAARAASIEVEWQTGRWGEVEDTHDVEKEDLRRQLGSVVLLVTGTGSGKQSH